jgi:acylglycerol lipase
VIVHGLGDHSTRFAPVAETLVRSGFLVLSYDQLGHGKTGHAMPRFETLVNDINVAISHVRSDANQPCFLYGQSLGGGLVLYHALKSNPTERVARVIASAPLLKPAIEPPRWKLLVGKTLGRLWPGLTLATEINANHLTHDQAEVERYRNDPLIHHKVSAALGITMLERCEWSLAHAAELRVPTLLIHGTEDRITSATASQDFAQRAGAICELKLWQGLFHDLHFELERDQVLDCVVDWINRTIGQ